MDTRGTLPRKISLGLYVVLFLTRVGVEGFLVDVPSTVYLYVSPHGSDDNTGLYPNQPLKSIQAAVDMIPDLKTRCNMTDIEHDVVVELLRGYYELESTLRITNTKNRQITLRAYQNEDVHIIGGRIIPTDGFQPVKNTQIFNRIPAVSRDKVLQFQLSEVDILDLGQLQIFGFYRFSEKNYIEVFENGKPYRLAQYPNEGYINVLSVEADGRTFTFDSERPWQWVDEKHAWCHGFWYWSWADDAANVTYFNDTAKTVTLGSKPYYGIRKGYYDEANPTVADYNHQGGYFRFFNVLSELDQPGEYFVDRESGILYIYPITSTPYTDSDVLYASVVNDCIEIGENARNIRIEGITVEACRKFGIIGKNVNNVVLTQMQIRNTGSYGVHIVGTNVEISKSLINDCDGGIYIKGGDIPTLMHSGNVIEDNIISNFGRTALVGSYGAIIEGVGCHFHHNIMVNGSYTGVRWTGNDHTMEYNYMSDMCVKASDCGAFMSGRSFFWRGVKIQFNHIQNTRRKTPGTDCRGIMLDDQLSGVIILNNVFHDNDVHCNIGGGRDNIINQNIMSNAALYSIRMDDRGFKTGHTQWMFDRLSPDIYKSTLWQESYPKLASLTDGSGNPKAPEGNQISQNIFQSGDVPHLVGRYGSNWYNITDSIFVTEDSNFYAPAYGDYRPRCLLEQFVNKTHFKSPVLGSKVGPRTSIGPNKQNIAIPNLGYKTGDVPEPNPCSIASPRSPPGSTNLPDGSSLNTRYNLPSKEGCWFAVDLCPNESGLERSRRSQDNQFIRDVTIETKDNSDKDEQACFNRVQEMITRCGNISSFEVIFAPTGASTLGGDGCFMDRTSCPLRKLGAALSRDTWAETHVDGATNEGNCLGRALPFWRWCGSSTAYPITSVFRPTGKKITVGGGCYIHPQECPTDPTLNRLFYDGDGGANYATDFSPRSCMARAQHFWKYCGSDNRYKVTAYFRPDGSSQSFP